MNKDRDNAARIEALKKVSNTCGQINWVGNIVHDTLYKCLVAINLETNNKGSYDPQCVKIAGLNGYFLVNEDGSLFADMRVIKEDEKKFRIETLSSKGFNEYVSFWQEAMNRD